MPRWPAAPPCSTARNLSFVIQCDLGFGDERLGYLFTLGDGAPHVEKGWDGEASATVRQDLVDLLRELFGPAGPYGVTRELSAKIAPSPEDRRRMAGTGR